VNAAARARPSDRLSSPMVAVLGKRGRFLVAEPLFGHGPRTAVDARGSREGDLVLVGSGRRGARVVRQLGRPDVARDVLEGLMIDRGLRRAYARAAADEAEKEGVTPRELADRYNRVIAEDLAALGLSFLLAACNNGGGPTY